MLSKNVSVVVHVDHLNIITEDLESEHDTSWQTLDENNDYETHGEAWKNTIVQDSSEESPQLTRRGRSIKTPNRFSP